MPRYLPSVVGIAVCVLVTAAAPDTEPRKDDPKHLQLSARNVKQLVVAMHNYHGDYQKLPPPALKGKDGKPLLSWRVALLPYIEQDRLYKQFKLDEPWDSDANKKLLEKMPAIFAPPGVTTKEPYTTFYQVFVGDKAIFRKDRQLTLGQITVQDGTSNTLMIVEAAEAVPWTKPQDIDFDPSKETPKLGGIFKSSFHGCFGDGSVRRFKKQLDDAGKFDRLVKQLITVNGGENEDVEPLLFK